MEEALSMSVPNRGQPRERPVPVSRWTVISSALDSTPRTVRLCAIMLAAGIPPSLLAYMIHH